MSKTLAVTALFLLLCVAVDVDACTCARSGSPCSAFKETPVVFAGVVKSVDEQKAEVLRFGRKETVRTGLTAHFQVEETLKGIDAAEVDVVTGGGGGDCGYPFKVGERYLVYAYKSEAGALGASMSRTVIGPRRRAPSAVNTLSATICSRTRPLTGALDDLELLRAFVGGKPQTRIFGSVLRYVQPPGTYEYDINYVGPLASLPVTAEGPGGRFETQTDGEGSYRFKGLAPGKYRLKVKLPEGYGPLFGVEGAPVEVVLAPGDCAAEQNFAVQLDGRIGGRVFDADGRPVPDQVQVSIVTLASAGKNFRLAESRSDYTKGGRYEIGGIPPGRYLLGVSIADPPDVNSPYPPTYYPKTGELNSATVINFGEGQKLTGYDIHLPPRLQVITISGTVTRANGRPAVGATVDLFDAGEPQRGLELARDVKTDARGRFTLRAYKGRDYLVHAYIDRDYLAGTGVQSESVPVSTGGPVPSVSLVLNRQGIFVEQK